jgi:hypothetical protein
VVAGKYWVEGARRNCGFDHGSGAASTRKDKAMDHDKQRQGYLEVLTVYLRRGLQNPTLFRTCADHWYAFDRGDTRLLNSSGNPHWLNRPNPQKRQQREALCSFDWISLEAMEVIEKPELFDKNDLARSMIRDHAVPLAELARKLRALDDPTPAAIEACLRQFYLVGIITYEQNKKLNDAGLGARMPDGWNGADPYARYTKVGIRKAERAP